MDRHSKSKQKTYYNKKARRMAYEVGDDVLLLIPTDHNKILVQWEGPFKIKEKLNSMNFRKDLGHRSQTYHANLLKKYHRRPDFAAIASIMTDCTKKGRPNKVKWGRQRRQSISDAEGKVNQLTNLASTRS